MNLYFSGMIGSGKTTLGRRLAFRLGWDFDDLDEAMERLAGKGFRRVVAEDGWLGFRQYEYTICKQFATMDRTVIALGGGTVRYEWNRDALQGTGINILLTAALSDLARRVQDNDRPRVHEGTTLSEDLVLMWEHHRHVYRSFADAIHRTDNRRTVEEEVELLLELLTEEGLC